MLFSTILEWRRQGNFLFEALMISVLNPQMLFDLLMMMRNMYHYYIFAYFFVIPIDKKLLPHGAENVSLESMIF